MQPFPDFDFLFEDNTTTPGDQLNLSPIDDLVPSPDVTSFTCNLDFDDAQFFDDLNSFKSLADNIADPLSIYETVSEPKSVSPRKISRSGSTGSTSDGSSINSEYNTPSPSSPPSPISIPTSSSTEDSVQDALAALEEKLSQPTYTAAKDNEMKKGDQEKPDVSYIAMIAKAILSTPGKRVILAGIYKYIMDNYPYYNNNEKGWRNSIRHNLSLNECFIKTGRSEGGKGNYWSIHHSCVEEFSRGDYSRRQARKRVRQSKKVKSMVSSLPTDKKEALPYVPMGAGYVARTGYHPYARNPRMQYNQMPRRTNTSPTNSASSTNSSPVHFNAPSPSGYDVVSPAGFNAPSPQSFSVPSPQSYSSLSPNCYTNVSPTSYGNLHVDTSFGNTGTSNAKDNAQAYAQGNGYTYQNGLLMPYYAQPNVATNYPSNYPSNYPTTWNVPQQNAYESNGNYYGFVNAGVIIPNTNTSYSCQ